MTEYGILKKLSANDRAPRVTSGYGLDYEPENIYSMMLCEASRALAEIEACGSISTRVTAFLTESGTIYCAENTDKPTGVSTDERKKLHILEKNGDTHILKMVTLWLDGTVGTASMEFYKAALTINPDNAFAEVLLAKSPRTEYNGYFLPNDYKIQYLGDFII